MIHLITLNPAIDEYITIDKFQIGKTNYRDNTKRVLGGKAINVAIVLNNLQVDFNLVTALNTKDKFITDSLKKFPKVLIDVKKTRTNLKINVCGEITEINDRGFSLTKSAQNSFIEYINESVTVNDIVLIAGNPHDDDIEFQYQLAQLVNNVGGKLILDSNKFTLAMIKQLKPLMVKPNDDEIKILYGNDEILTNGIDLANYCDEVIISHGSQGLTYICKGKIINQVAIEGEVINTVGAGDSLVAGYIFATIKQMASNDKVTFSKYTASASVFNNSLATIENIKKYDPDNYFTL